MKVRIAKTKPGQVESFTFPNITAELTDETIDEHKMRQALKRLGKALAKQLQKSRPALVAVNLKGIDFNMVYASERKER